LPKLNVAVSGGWDWLLQVLESWEELSIQQDGFVEFSWFKLQTWQGNIGKSGVNGGFTINTYGFHRI
jgi:hypothetical protein